VQYLWSLDIPRHIDAQIRIGTPQQAFHKPLGIQWATLLTQEEWQYNTYRVVSVNHHAASSAFREPPPRGKTYSSSRSRSRSRFKAIMSIANCGYRTQYPLVMVAR